MPHTLVTQYRYYSLNQVVEQKSPDGGLSKFWYDQLGRLVFSQNEKQYQVNQYSYTRYDLLGRIEEVGQLTSNATMTQAIAQSVSLTNTWMNTTVNASKEQITRTVYDVSQSSLCTPAPSVLCQRNLRNRVSYSYVQPTASFSNNSLPYTSATYYSYDIHGNVDVLLQHYNSGIMQTIAGNAFKRIEYKYDLISGKVNEVAYQPGYSDQFYHRYSYDAENKLTKAYTSPDRIVWELEADYTYYRHGPLARVELGETGVQGMDYAYTLQGWLKTVNSTAVTSAADMGGDGTLTGRKMAGDVYGFALHYNSTDYKAINLSKTVVAPVTNTALPAFKDLYNGNIAAMAVTFSHVNFGAAGAGLNQPLLYKYRYDQLNRIREMDAYSGLNQATNAWTFSSPMTAYQERVSYDGNGNILTYSRNGDAARTAMDNMTYSYISGTNKLDNVVDVSPDATSNYSDYNDLRTGQLPGNYSYDAIGNLIVEKEKIGTSTVTTNITWNVYGKIASVTKSGVTTSYTYDASGNRISKTTGSKTTFYVRDASGNVMAVYESGNANINGGNLSQIEVHLYGSSRLGIWNPNRNVQVVPAPVTYPMTGLSSAGVVRTYKRGLKFFELSNHLGNVLVTVSDRKVAKDANTDGVIDSYVADVVSGGDYYPFGMQMPSRIYSTDKYRYSINGQEKSSEIGINLTTAEFWQYDARIVRRWNVDPVVKVGESLYAVFGNNPILVVDPSGADTLTFTRNLYKDKRSPYKGHGVRVNQNYELQGSIEIKAGEGPDIFYYRENITSFTDNGKEFSTSLIQFNPQGQFPYTSGGRIMKGFHDDQYALAAMAPDWLIKHYYNKWLSKTGNERDWPTTKAWGTAMAYRKDVRFARTLKNITDIVYMAFGAGALLKGTLTPAIAEAFPAGFATSQFEGFYIRSASTMANGTYTKTIQTLAFMGESGSGNLTKLVRSIEIEARAAGANTLQINGIEIVNSRILSTSKAAAEKFGFTFEQISANSIKLTKILK